MAGETIRVEVKGLKELQAAMKKFPQQVKKYMAAAGNEAAKDVLNTEGLQKYPPATGANAPPTPYYIRGKGTQYQSGLRATSERLGTQWNTTSTDFKTTIENRASYAKWVHGEKLQASFMGPKGWRKLKDAAEEKIANITKIYQGWVDKLLRDIKL